MSSQGKKVREGRCLLQSRSLITYEEGGKELRPQEGDPGFWAVTGPCWIVALAPFRPHSGDEVGVKNRGWIGWSDGRMRCVIHLGIQPHMLSFPYLPVSPLEAQQTARTHWEVRVYGRRGCLENMRACANDFSIVSLAHSYLCRVTTLSQTPAL